MLKNAKESMKQSIQEVKEVWLTFLALKVRYQHGVSPRKELPDD